MAVGTRGRNAWKARARAAAGLPRSLARPGAHAESCTFKGPVRGPRTHSTRETGQAPRHFSRPLPHRPPSTRGQRRRAPTRHLRPPRRQPPSAPTGTPILPAPHPLPAVAPAAIPTPKRRRSRPRARDPAREAGSLGTPQTPRKGWAAHLGHPAQPTPARTSRRAPAPPRGAAVPSPLRVAPAPRPLTSPRGGGAPPIKGAAGGATAGLCARVRRPVPRTA